MARQQEETSSLDYLRIAELFQVDCNRKSQKMEDDINSLHSKLKFVRNHPLVALKDKVFFEILTVLAGLSKRYSKKVAKRFLRSAAKRNPNRYEVPLHGEQYKELVRSWESIRLVSGDKYNALKQRLERGPKISLIFAVEEISAEELQAMIASIVSQSYECWELFICIQNSRKFFFSQMSNLRHNDKRVHFVLREEGTAISSAVNSMIFAATGKYVALIDQNCILDRDALLIAIDHFLSGEKPKILYFDHDQINDKGERSEPHFKPGWNRDLLYSTNYVGSAVIYSASLVKSVGGLRPNCDGAHDYDLLLRCVEQLDDEEIDHVPKVLYSFRETQVDFRLSLEKTLSAWVAGKWALTDHLRRLRGAAVEVKMGHAALTYKVVWPLDREPLVTIIIPTRDRLDLLQKTVNSVIDKTMYRNYEVIIVDNGSVHPATLAWLKSVQLDPRIKVLRDDGPFNYSALNNVAVTSSHGELIALMNNDIEVIDGDWLREMVSLAVRPETGCVGAKLYYPDFSIQHAGVIVGVGGVAGHIGVKSDGNDCGYLRRFELRQNISAVTGACLVVRREIYEKVGGLNEKDLAVAFNDIDLCLKIDAAGYRNVWTPWATLFHHESASRGQDDSQEKRSRFRSECNYMKKRWLTDTYCDAAYNINLSLDGEEVSFGSAVWEF